MLIGYARVSTADQTLALQQDALTKAGCDQTFTDTASGASAERTGLDQALSHLRPGDTLVVWRLDRLGRSLRHLIDTITDLEARGIGFRSITEAIDTTTSGASSSSTSSAPSRNSSATSSGSGLRLALALRGREEGTAADPRGNRLLERSPWPERFMQIKLSQ